MLIVWCAVGLGVYVGLVVPKHSKMFRGQYSWIALLKGFVLTVPLWPIALFNNRDNHLEKQ